jgi:hypothetical protein
LFVFSQFHHGYNGFFVLGINLSGAHSPASSIGHISKAWDKVFESNRSRGWVVSNLNGIEASVDHTRASSVPFKEVQNGTVFSTASQHFNGLPCRS